MIRRAVQIDPAARHRRGDQLMPLDAPLADAPVLVGLMSGTSLDGVAAAAVRFHRTGDGDRPELLAFESVAVHR